MSHKTVICFAIWTSFWSALFNHFYTVYFGSFGVPWIMFVCMAIFFGMNGTPKQVPGMILSAFCGLAWGQFDFILINFFGGTCHMSAEMASFMAILVGTAITMYIHIKLLGATPFGFMPFIFAGLPDILTGRRQRGRTCLHIICRYHPSDDLWIFTDILYKKI